MKNSEQDDRGPKTPQELGISNHEWVTLAEELVYFRDFAKLLPHSPLGCMYTMRVNYLEVYFGITQPDQKEA